MKLLAYYECKCGNNYDRIFTSWPFLRNFWTYCRKCDRKNWPRVVRDEFFKIVQWR